MNVKKEQIPKELAEQVRKSFEAQEYRVYLEEVPEKIERSSNLLIFGDGDYLLRENTIGRFMRKVSDRKVPSLGDGPCNEFSMFLPEIPVAILRQQVAFYRGVMKKHQNAEAYTLILWDKEEKKYLVTCPEQEVSGATVVYSLDMAKYPSSRYIQVVSCHSHDTMGAFFSGVDDADEKADMLYMVLGRLDKDVPEYKIRANLKGREICKLDMDFLFDCSEQEYKDLAPLWKGKDNFNEEWLENVVPLRRSIHSRLSLGSQRFPFHQRRRGFKQPWPDSAGTGGFASVGFLDPRQETFSFAEDFNNRTSSSTHLDEIESTNEIRIIAISFLEKLRSHHYEDALQDLIYELADAGYDDCLKVAFDEIMEYENQDQDREPHQEKLATEEWSVDPAVVNEHLHQVESHPELSSAERDWYEFRYKKTGGYEGLTGALGSSLSRLLTGKEKDKKNG